MNCDEHCIQPTIAKINGLRWVLKALWIWDVHDLYALGKENRIVHSIARIVECCQGEGPFPIQEGPESVKQRVVLIAFLLTGCYSARCERPSGTFTREV